MTAMPRLPVVGRPRPERRQPADGAMAWRGAVRKVFAPNPVPEAFEQGFPKALAFAPRNCGRSRRTRG